MAVDTSKVGKACTTAGEDTTNCGTQATTHPRVSPQVAGSAFVRLGSQDLSEGTAVSN